MIHRYWTGPNPPTTKPDPAIKDWRDDTLPLDCLQFIDARYNLVDYRKLHHRSNMVRWWLLYHFGGTWIDYDIDPYQSFPETVPFTARGKTHGGPCVRVMSFPAGHDVPALALLHLASCPTGQVSVEVSGDVLLDACLEVAGCDVELFNPKALI